MTLVAEAACNHTGQFERALEMIRQASAVSEIAYIKFQKRDNKELLGEQACETPHPDPENSFGPTYEQHRNHLEFNLSQHRVLKEECKKFGIGYACSVWDKNSAAEIASLDPDYIKVPSACNIDFELLLCIFSLFKKPVHISLGMLTRDEISNLVSFLTKHGVNNRVVIYSCVSTYPVSENSLCLSEISYLKREYGKYFLGLGFSGHHTSIVPDVVALALGADWIERHFTLDKSWRGTDQKSSLTVSELEQLCEILKIAKVSLGYKTKEILMRERQNQSKLAPKVKRPPITSA